MKLTRVAPQPNPTTTETSERSQRFRDAGDAWKDAKGVFIAALKSENLVLGGTLIKKSQPWKWNAVGVGLYLPNLVIGGLSAAFFLLNAGSNLVRGIAAGAGNASGASPAASAAANGVENALGK